MPYKHNEPRRHKIPKAKYKVSNWREYDQALQQRGSLTVWVTPEALEAWAAVKTGQRGRPPSYSDIAIETGIMPKGPVDVVIDSSGLKVFGAGEWRHEKHGAKPRRSWRRLHLAIDPDRDDILAAE